MLRAYVLLLFAGSCVLTTGCDTNDSDPLIRLRLQNESAERGIQQNPSYWRTFKGVGNQKTPGFEGDEAYVFEWSSEEAHTHSRALAVHADSTLGNISGEAQYATWWQIVDLSPAEAAASVDKQIVLRGALKTKDLMGTGVFLRIAANDYPASQRLNTPNQRYASIAYTHNIAFGPRLSGTHDWRPFSAVLRPAPEGIQSVEVQLGLTGTRSGSVYFDDLELVVE